MQLHFALYLSLPKYIMHSLYKCLHNCSMQIYVHICALPVYQYCIVSSHVHLTAHDTGNISETLHNALPTLTPHCKHSSQRTSHPHCAPSMKSVTAQILCYVMAFVTAYSIVFIRVDAFQTTQCHGHTDAATTLLTFRLHTALAVWILL